MALINQAFRVAGTVPVNRVLLDAIQASTFVSRSIMLGAFAVYNDSAAFEEQTTDLADYGQLILKTEINQPRFLATTAFAGTLTATAFAWTTRKMILNTRAEYIAQVGAKIVGTLTTLLSGGDMIMPSGLQGQTRGLSALRAEVIKLVKGLEAQKAAGVYEVASTLDFSYYGLSEAIKDVIRQYDVMETTFRTLEHANTLGAEGLLFDPFAFGSESILDGDDVSRLRKIAANNKVWKRSSRVGTQQGGVFMGNTSALPNLFADKQLSDLATAFIPTDVPDDIFNLKKELAPIRSALNGLKAGLMKGARTLEQTTSKALEFSNYALTAATPEGAQRYLRMKAELQGVAAIEMLGYTSTIGADIEIVEALSKALDAKVATVKKASESVFLRLTASAVGFSVEKGLRLSTGFQISKATAKTAGQYAKTGTKFAGKVVGKVFWVDTAIWAATGLIDILFIEDDVEYENAFAQYLSDNWGFSPLGWVIDSVFDLFLPEEVQETLVDLVSGLIAVVSTYDDFQDVVLAIANFYIDEYDISFLPFNISSPQEVDLDMWQYGFKSLAKEPQVILEVFAAAIAIKLVFYAWIVPVWGHFSKQVGWATSD
jgi:hypothetical protein